MNNIVKAASVAAITLYAGVEAQSASTGSTADRGTAPEAGELCVNAANCKQNLRKITKQEYAVWKQG
jgi:hypothetical protein